MVRYGRESVPAGHAPPLFLPPHCRAPQALRPDVIIFSGERTHLFSDQMHQTLPDATPVMTLHYAHRLGADREALALEEVRHVLDTWRPKSR